nr:hypothetical protein [Bacillaceae bacterium]
MAQSSLFHPLRLPLIFILIFGSPGKQGGTGKIRRKGAGAFPEKLRREVVFRHIASDRRRPEGLLMVWPRLRPEPNHQGGHAAEKEAFPFPL